MAKIFKGTLSRKQIITKLHTGETVHAEHGYVKTDDDDFVKQLEENPYWEKSDEKAMAKDIQSLAAKEKASGDAAYNRFKRN